MELPQGADGGGRGSTEIGLDFDAMFGTPAPAPAHLDLLSGFAAAPTPAPAPTSLDGSDGFDLLFGFGAGSIIGPATPPPLKAKIPPPISPVAVPPLLVSDSELIPITAVLSCDSGGSWNAPGGGADSATASPLTSSPTVGSALGGSPLAGEPRRIRRRRGVQSAAASAAATTAAPPSLPPSPSPPSGVGGAEGQRGTAAPSRQWQLVRFDCSRGGAAELAEVEAALELVARLYSPLLQPAPPTAGSPLAGGGGAGGGGGGCGASVPTGVSNERLWQRRRAEQYGRLGCWAHSALFWSAASLVATQEQARRALRRQYLSHNCRVTASTSSSAPTKGQLQGFQGSPNGELHGTAVTKSDWAELRLRDDLSAQVRAAERAASWVHAVAATPAGRGGDSVAVMAAGECEAFLCEALKRWRRGGGGDAQQPQREQPSGGGGSWVGWAAQYAGAMGFELSFCEDTGQKKKEKTAKVRTKSRTKTKGSLPRQRRLDGVAPSTEPAAVQTAGQKGTATAASPLKPAASGTRRAFEGPKSSGPQKIGPNSPQAKPVRGKTAAAPVARKSPSSKNVRCAHSCCCCLLPAACCLLPASGGTTRRWHRHHMCGRSIWRQLQRRRSRRVGPGTSLGRVGLGPESRCTGSRSRSRHFGRSVSRTHTPMTCSRA